MNLKEKMDLKFNIHPIYLRICPLLLFENKNNFENENNFDYIYLIEKYNVNEKQTIFKFGKSNRNIIYRLKENGREAKILLLLNVSNCNLMEKKNLSILRSDTNIKQIKELGRETFSCENKSYIIDKIITNIN